MRDYTKPTLEEMLTSFGHASKCVLSASQQVLAAVSEDGRDAGIKALELALRMEQHHRSEIVAYVESLLPAHGGSLSVDTSSEDS